ncbi:MAG: O-antigen ligase family protein [Acidobacteriaceae bacterium]|nr:O-antigen ligase family protein [Acidobacteriaceae bacterium]
MQLSQQAQDRILLYVAVTAAALIHVSIAGSQLCLGLGILLLLIFRRQLPFPRVWVPLACFFMWTILADCLSPDPWGGRAQIRKCFVFLFIPLMFSVFVTQFAKIYYLMVAWTVAATASGAWSLIQFVEKYQYAHRTGREFYVTYLERRITGFESHWMTFGALQLSVISLLLAHFFFARRRMPLWAYSSMAILSAAILLGMTRSIWLATIPAVLYLVWFWRPKMMIAVPVLIAVAFAVSPHAARERLTSLFAPRENVDSNEHRIVTFRTGLEMIKAHPLFGIGPEEIGRNFDRYVPADIPKPLPVGYYGHLHNIYIQYAAERGIPGLACMLWFIGLTLYDCAHGIAARVRSGITRDDSLFVLHGAVAVILGVLVGGLFEYNLGDSEVLMMFVCVVALAYCALKQRIHCEFTAPLTPSAETVSK